MAEHKDRGSRWKLVKVRRGSGGEKARKGPGGKGQTEKPRGSHGNSNDCDLDNQGRDTGGGRREEQAHLWRWGPRWHGLAPLLLLVLLLLKLLSQLQVAETRRALWLLLLQEQGDHVVLDGGDKEGCEAGCGLGEIQARFTFQSRFPSASNLSSSSSSTARLTAKHVTCGGREHTPSAEMVRRKGDGAEGHGCHVLRSPDDKMRAARLRQQALTQTCSRHPSQRPHAPGPPAAASPGSRPHLLLRAPCPGNDLGETRSHKSSCLHPRCAGSPTPPAPPAESPGR